jgi:hypothetical protein
MEVYLGLDMTFTVGINLPRTRSTFGHISGDVYP